MPSGDVIQLIGTLGAVLVFFVYGVLVGSYQLFPYRLLEKAKRRFVDNEGSLFQEKEFHGELQYSTVTEGLKKNSVVDVHFIDCGYFSHAYLINASGGKTALMGCGYKRQVGIITQYLDRFDISRIDYVFITMYGNDHTKGLDAILSKYDVGKVLLPGHTTKEATERQVVDRLQKSDTEYSFVDRNDWYQLGDETGIEVFGPTIKYDSSNSKTSKPERNNSIISRLVSPGGSVLFMSDGMIAVEEELLEADIDLSSDILQVGHHGTAGASSVNFLQAVNPTESIVSTPGIRYNEPYGLLRQDELVTTIDKLKHVAQSTVHRSDNQGTIVVQIDETSYTIKTSDPPNSGQQWAWRSSDKLYLSTGRD